MKRPSSLIAILCLLCALTALPAEATDPLVYDSTIVYAGAGKHPKTGVTGLILDGRSQGLTLVCYDYLVITTDKIKGQVSGIAERISGNKIEKIATYGSNKVEAFDFSQIPPGQDGCTGRPTELPGFNLGIASDCVEVTKPLAAGDIVRWTLKFKKGSKLKGAEALVQVSGSVLPFASFSSVTAARTEALMSRIAGPAFDLAPRSER